MQRIFNYILYYILLRALTNLQLLDLKSHVTAINNQNVQFNYSMHYVSIFKLQLFLKEQAIYFYIHFFQTRKKDRFTDLYIFFVTLTSQSYIIIAL